MLPSQLLRIKTRKGEIIPLFIGGENKSEHSELAKIIINEFEESAANKEKKKILNERISLLERDFDDYRLVRGLSTLLERRCKFIAAISRSDENCEDITCPADIRKKLWEESSRRGFALTPTRRDEIVNAISARTTNSPTSIIQSMWSDLDENMILEWFDSVNSEELLRWYDLSLLQTLLFTCTNLQFSVKGGASWKNILRKVKRLGLMYNLKEQATSDKSPDFSDRDSKLVCSIDGPVSLFKMTDRYGTSIAKLIPFVISSSWWHLSALIVRKTVSGKKIYEFKASSADFRQLNLREPSQNEQGNSINNRPSSSFYDSSLEEKFATRFEHLANRWRIKREPEPLIVGNGVAFIPDFLFEKYGRKVYLEIVGFWTKEYLEKKFQKINDILRNSNIDLFVAVDEELSCSKLFSPTTHDPSNSKIIFFKKASVPIKKLQEHLKSIDKLQIASNISNSELRIRFDGTKDVISIEEISEAYGVPIEIATAIASRDNSMDYLRINSWFLLKSKAMGLAELLNSTTKFTEACAILSKNSIPEACHAELVSILGFDVVWQNMNSDDAIIVKRP